MDLEEILHRLEEASELLDWDIIDECKEAIRDLIENTLDGYEEYYWTVSWNNYMNTGDDVVVRNRLNALITVMINAPEFQLM